MANELVVSFDNFIEGMKILRSAYRKDGSTLYFTTTCAALPPGTEEILKSLGWEYVCNGWIARVNLGGEVNGEILPACDAV